VPGEKTKGKSLYWLWFRVIRRARALKRDSMAAVGTEVRGRGGGHAGRDALHWGWALVCVLIFFSERWAEREREFFGRGDVGWGRLE